MKNINFINMLVLFLNVYIKCMDVWKKLNVNTQANRYSLFLTFGLVAFSCRRECRIDWSPWAL